MTTHSIFLPGKFHRQRSLKGYSPQGHKESDRAERLSTVQFSRSVMSNSLRPHGLQHTRLPCPSLSCRFCSIELMMPSKHLILCHPPSSPSFNLSQHQDFFSSESVLHIRWPKYWVFSFSISPSNEYLGLISFRMDWLDLLVQGTLKSLLQQHSSKASILRHLAFFIVQLSHACMTTPPPYSCSSKWAKE